MLSLKHLVGMGQTIRFRRDIIDDASGMLVKSSGWERNLILDTGMEDQANYVLQDLWKVLVLGTGTTPTKRDSGAITAAKVGTTVTADGAIFEAADVQRVLKWDDDPQEYRIVGYNGPTSVDVDIPGDRAGAEFTIWYANETTHGAEYMRVSTYATDAGFCQSTFAAGTWTHRRTFLSNVFAENKLIKELGWSRSAVAADPMLGRALVPGGGDLVLTGQRYRVQVELANTYGPQVSTAHPDVGNNGFSTLGTFGLESAYLPSKVAANGTTEYWDGEWGTLSFMEPLQRIACIDAFTSAAAIQPITGNSVPMSNYGRLVNAQGNAGAAAYVPGSHQRLWVAGFSVNQANSANINGVGWGCGDWNSTTYLRQRVRFDAPQEKTSLYELTVSMGLKWSRVLVN